MTSAAVEEIRPPKIQESWFQRPIFDQLPFLTGEVLIISIIMILAVFSRFYILGNRVMSHDETNHVVPSFDLFQGRGYRHDPVTHGPFQFHIIALIFFMFGDSDFTARVPSAMFSIATVFFAWWGYRRYLGRAGALAASTMMLISPFILFYGRYTRNEAFIGFSMVVMVFAFLRYLETGRTRFLYLAALGLVFHFITKETSFIYSAQALLFLAGLFLYRMIQRPWLNAEDKRRFQLGLAAGVILLGLALATFATTHTITPAATPTSGAAATLPSPTPAAPSANPITIFPALLLLLAVADLVGAGIFLVRGVSIAALRRERSFDLLILVGTLVLPQLSAFPIKMVGWDPLDYTNPGILHTLIFVVPIVLISALVGLWWRPRIWLGAFALFYGIFIVFFTTFFTNGVGFFTGLVGALGYWLSQQGVNRGSQPLYFYALIQIPMYEFLPAIGAIAAFILALRHPQLASIAEQPLERFDGEMEYPETLLPQPNGQESLDVSEDSATTQAAPFIRQTVPVVWFLLFWALTSLAAFSVAGEKMPWLTFHITLPLILVSGWSVGYLIETTPWRELLKNRLVLTMLLVPVFFFALGSLLVGLLGANPPFQGKDLAQLQNTATFVMAVIGVLGSGAGVAWLTRAWTGPQLWRAAAVGFFAVLAVLTARVAIRASYINYDTAKEYLVYAHAARGPKDVLADVTEISERTTGGLDIKVAYGGDALYPYWWYFRDFPNKVWYGDTITRELNQDPVIIVDDKSYGKIQSVVGNNYDYYEVTRLWWPNQDYFGLTWERIKGALTNPAIRAGIWNIWFNADYTAYAQATNNANLTLTTWDPSNKMRVYIRKDIVAQMWKYGVAPAAPIQTVDPYQKGTIQLAADPVFGSEGSQPGQFEAPRGVAVAADGSVYVADSRNHRIEHFGADGHLIQTWGTFADISKGAAPGGTFDEPWGIAAAPDGSIFVADTWNNRIQKFTADGKFVKMWGYFGQAEKPEAFWGPRGIAVNAQGQVFVTDTGNKRIVVFDGDGNFVTQFGSVGTDIGQLDEPVGIAVDLQQGLVYVADTWNQRIQVFTPSADGKTYSPTKQWSITGWYGQSLDNKPFLALDGQGHLFVTDPEGSRVLEFSSDGTFQRAWGDNGTTNSSFGLAMAVGVAPDGSVWVTDAGNHRLMHFTLPK